MNGIVTSDGGLRHTKFPNHPLGQHFYGLLYARGPWLSNHRVMNIDALSAPYRPIPFHSSFHLETSLFVDRLRNLRTVQVRHKLLVIGFLHPPIEKHLSSSTALVGRVRGQAVQHEERLLGAHDLIARSVERIEQGGQGIKA